MKTRSKKQYQADMADESQTFLIVPKVSDDEVTTEEDI